MLKSIDGRKVPNEKNKKDRVALHTSNVEGGLSITIQDSPEYIEGYIQMPGIGLNDGSWLVSGESMMPTIHKGSRVVLRKIQNLDSIVWNEIYVVDLKEHGAKVKRIKPGKNKNEFLLTSDNSRFDPFIAKKENILGIYRVLMAFEMF